MFEGFVLLDCKSLVGLPINFYLMAHKLKFYKGKVYKESSVNGAVAQRTLL